jgi:alanine-glyoxylate transaminase/serine-glyoxylate transaminase/serine-pyruvate transaminase
MCFVNMVSPGDKAIVCRNGVFGGRMIENVERCGGVPIVVEDAWGAPVDPNKVEEALERNPDAKIVAFVHAETSTGVQSDAQSIAAIAQKHGAMTIMDAVTSLAGVPVLLDEWGIDACYAASQKCLSCTPAQRPSASAIAWSSSYACTEKVHSSIDPAAAGYRRDHPHVSPHHSHHLRSRCTSRRSCCRRKARESGRGTSATTASAPASRPSS